VLHARLRTSALAALATAAAGLVATAVSVAPATATDPPGNNGTVKIAPDGEMDGIPQNHPHQGCTFQVEWYGFDEGDDIVSTVAFEMQAPTADVVLGGDEPRTVAVGGDAATGAGTATGADAVQTYTLTFDGEPHAVQGYHVKLTIHTPGSIGADTKHKVFWVTGCETPSEPSSSTETLPTDGTTVTGPTDTAEPTVPTEPGETSGTGGTGSSATSTEPSDDESTAGTVATQTAAPVPGAPTTPDDTEVAGEQASGGQDVDVPSAVDAGERGPVAQLTGSRSGLVVAGLGLLVGLGALLVRWRRA
jgi:hypothetical protein